MDRNKSLDIIRSIAILLVINIHCVEGLYYFDILVHNSPTTAVSWILQTIVYVLGRLGVPLFLMLTGALVLTQKNTSIKHWLFTKIAPLYITTIIWFFIYYIKNIILLGSSSILKDIGISTIKSIRLDTSSGLHFWYMPVIIGIYIFLPLVSKIVQLIPMKNLVAYSSIALIIVSFLPMVNRFLAINSFKNCFYLPYNLQHVFRLIIYPLYVVLGYLCYNRKIVNRVKTKYLILAFLVNISIVILLQYQCHLLGSTKFGHYFWYDNFCIVLLGLLLFELLSRIKLNNKIVLFLISSLSKYSFGIYLVHILVLYSIMEMVKLQIWILPVKLFVLFAYTLILSWIFTMIVGKVPVLNSLLINYKKKKHYLNIPNVETM